jgi:hypothetical protein
MIGKSPKIRRLAVISLILFFPSLGYAEESRTVITERAAQFQQCVAREFLRQIKLRKRLTDMICHSELKLYKQTLIRSGVDRNNATLRASIMKRKTVITIKQILLAATLFPEKF